MTQSHFDALSVDDKSYIIAYFRSIDMMEAIEAHEANKAATTNLKVG